MLAPIPWSMPEPHRGSTRPTGILSRPGLLELERAFALGAVHDRLKGRLRGRLAAI